MRRSIIVGNWKMNMLISSAGKWIDDLLEKIHFAASVDIVIAPPFTALAKLRESINDSSKDLVINDEIIEKLKLIDVNSITPFEALIKLNELIDDIE